MSRVTFFTLVLLKKRIELLHELVPSPAPIGVLGNPASNAASDRKDAEAAARALGREIKMFEASTAGEIDTAFAALVHSGVRALALGNDPFFNSRRDQLAYLAIRQAIPMIVPYRDYVTAGGLMSYGTDRAEVARQHGLYVGRVLKGERPANLSVLLPSKFELIVNLRTAKAINLRIPESFLLR